MKLTCNNLRKFICVLLIITCFAVFIPNISLAELVGEFGEPSDFEGESKVDNIATKSAATVINIVRVGAATIAVVMLFVLAMKYMTSSAGDRADIKKHAIAYVVGAFILFGAVGILGVLNEIGTGIK